MGVLPGNRAQARSSRPPRREASKQTRWPAANGQAIPVFPGLHASTVVGPRLRDSVGGRAGPATPGCRSRARQAGPNLDEPPVAPSLDLHEKVCYPRSRSRARRPRPSHLLPYQRPTPEVHPACRDVSTQPSGSSGSAGWEQIGSQQTHTTALNRTQQRSTGILRPAEVTFPQVTGPDDLR